MPSSFVTFIYRKDRTDCAKYCGVALVAHMSKMAFADVIDINMLFVIRMLQELGG